MTGEFNRLLSRNEMGLFDDALKDYAALNSNSVSVAAHPRAQTNVPTSEHEQRLWFYQQQQPDAVLWQVAAYRVSGDVEIMKLVSAIQTLVGAMPDLDRRYHFDDNGDLHKLPGAQNGQTTRIVRANRPEDVVNLILARQAEPWNSEVEPPFQALLILTDQTGPYRGDSVLALFVHRVLDELCPMAAVLRNLAAAYNGMPLTSVAPQSAAFHPMDDRAHPPVAWIRRSETSQAPIITAFADTAGLQGGMQRLALRYATTINPDLLEQDGGSHTSVAALIAAQFAGFMRHLGGHGKIAMRLETAAHGHQAAKHIRAVLTEDLSCAEAAALIQSQLDDAESEPWTDQNDLPQVWFTWIAVYQQPFLLAKLEPLMLPTLESYPDLSLAATDKSDGTISLELTTGQAVSPHIGAFLLERFVAFLRGEKSVGLPANTSDTAAEQAPADTNHIATLILSEFREALGIPNMGLDDDFFDHGGHSLIATRIIGRLLGAHGIEVHFNDLFSNPTAAALAQRATLCAPAHLETAGDETGSDSLIAPLAHAQMSLWKAYAAFGYGEIFNLPFALDFIEPVNEAVFEQAFRDILERHHGLRTLFFEQDGTVMQRVVPMDDVAQYKWFWTSLESEGIDRHMEAGYHFDLARELPLRLRFLRDAATGRQVLSFLFHHIVLDEWSVNLMMDELAQAYQARAAGKAPVWTTIPAPFHEFARQQHAEGVNPDHLAYWTDMLHDAPKGLDLFECTAPAANDHSETSAAGGWVEFKLERDVTEGLYALAKQSNASLFNIVYAAISASLHRIGQLRDLVIGTSASGRTDHLFFDTVGYFTTVVAHRVRFQPDMRIGALIAVVKNTVNESMPYSDVPIDLVEEALGMTPGRDHLFSVFIQIHAKNKLNGSLPGPDGKTITFRQVDPDRHESMLGLHFEVMEEVIDGERSIRVLMSYRSAEYGPPQVETIKDTTNAVFTLFAQPGASDLSLAI
jgi:Condensation domain/Phosphopantetheine attachment site